MAEPTWSAQPASTKYEPVSVSFVRQYYFEQSFHYTDLRHSVVG